MARAKTGSAKKQRGISLAPDLYERICVEADKYGRTWNETIELVLLRAFPAQDQAMQKPRESRPKLQANELEPLPA